MSLTHKARSLEFPCGDPPALGQVISVAEGILWTRIPLPFRLDHVNVYLIEDGDRWAVIDAGINTPEAIEAWDDLFAGPLSGFSISRVVVTHHHPDHIGLAGYLCRRFDAELLTSQTCYLSSKVISNSPNDFGLRQHIDFYTRNGMSMEAAGVMEAQGCEYIEQVSRLPQSFLRLLHLDRLTIGNREFRVLSGDGHAAEQIMLYCREENLFFAADQVMEKITPNVSVYAGEPNGDPLGHFLRTLRFLRENISADALVLPGHGRIFRGLHQRCFEIEEHHEIKCQLIRQTCAAIPSTVADLVPSLFQRPLEPRQMTFAFTETLAHINRLVRRGELLPQYSDHETRFSST